MNGLNIFAVTAWPAAGKSVATQEIVGELTRLGHDVRLFSDKEALLTQVADEITQAGLSLNTAGPIEVANFTLLNPREPRVSWGIKFKNAFTLNEAHRRLFEVLTRDSDGRSKTVVELAYGENAAYPDGRLRQNAKDFLDQLEILGLLPHMAFVDIYARLKYRGPRNDGRKDEVGYIPGDEFRKYFKDKGGWTWGDRARVNGRFAQIVNERIPKGEYQKRVRQTTEGFILPLIRGESGSNNRREILR